MACISPGARKKSRFANRKICVGRITQIENHFRLQILVEQKGNDKMLYLNAVRGKNITHPILGIITIMKVLQGLKIGREGRKPEEKGERGALNTSFIFPFLLT